MPSWAPHSHKDIHLIERVQMFGVKIISGEWNAACHDCLDQFGLVTLERRRLDLSLCLLYKYVNSMCYFPERLISKRRNNYKIYIYKIRVTHPLLLEQPFDRTNSHLYSHTISIWNSLPSSIVLAPSLNTFI